MPQYNVAKLGPMYIERLGIVEAEDHRDALAKVGLDSEKHKETQMYLHMHELPKGMIEVLDLQNRTYVLFVPITTT